MKASRNTEKFSNITPFSKRENLNKYRRGRVTGTTSKSFTPTKINNPAKTTVMNRYI
jgi:hypothetical protein